VEGAWEWIVGSRRLDGNGGRRKFLAVLGDMSGWSSFEERIEAEESDAAAAAAAAGGGFE
jgi:hypothetical protein